MDSHGLGSSFLRLHFYTFMHSPFHIYTLFSPCRVTQGRGKGLLVMVEQQRATTEGKRRVEVEVATHPFVSDGS